MASEIRRLLDRQAADLATLSDREAAAFLDALEDGRRELAERMAGIGIGRQEFTTYQLRATQVQINAGIEQLRARLLRQLDASTRVAMDAANRTLLQTLEKMEPEFQGAAVGLETAVVRRIADVQNLLLYKHSLTRYTADMVYRMQAGLIQSAVQRETLDQAVERLAGRRDSVLAGMRSRAELVVRMEQGRAFDAMHQAGMEEAETILDDPNDPDPLLARADEYVDARNHPFSRAVDGLTRPVRGEWKVPRADVLAAAAQMKRRATGILWPLVGAYYVGSQYPAHFNDRGRQTPWRASWGSQ